MSLRAWLTRLGLPWRFRIERLVEPIAAEGHLADFAPAGRGEELVIEDMAYVLHADGSSTVYRHVLVHVEDQAALDAWEQQVIRVPQGMARIWVPRARLLPPDGSGWRKAKVSWIGYRTSRGAMQAVRVVQRDIVPGSFVEVVTQEDWYGPDAFGIHLSGEFFLRTKNHARFRRLVVAHAEEASLHVARHNGAPSPEEEERHGYRLRRWLLRDVPGIPDRDVRSAPPPRDTLPLVEFSSHQDWSTVAGAYRRQLALPRDVARQSLPPVPVHGSDPVERALEAFRFASTRVRYGRPEAQREALAIRSPTEVATSFRGDCKDKTALLARLLAESGWHSDFVLVQGAGATRRPMLPAGRFDHVVLRAKLGERVIWLEPTPGVEDFDYLPATLQGSWGLVLSPDAPRLEQLPWLPLERDEVVVRMVGEVGADGHLRYELRERRRGHRAAEIRASLRSSGEDALVGLRLASLKASWPGASRLGHEAADVDALDRPVSLRDELRIPHWAAPAGRYRVCSPPWSQPLVASAVDAEERSLPLAPGLRGRVREAFELKLPEGWRMVGGEGAHELQTPWVRYRIDVRATPQGMRAERCVEVSGEAVPAERYPEFKAFLEEAARLDRSHLVVETEA